MILSVSRRTDIPNYYFDWFCNRLREGWLYVRNPMNEHQVSRIDLSPETVDCIVFWTKNPASMMERLSLLEPYPYYVQFTLTGYARDPILFTPAYTPSRHLEAFAEIADALEGYTETVVISFVDFYAKIRKNMNLLQVRELPGEELREFAGQLAAIAKSHGIAPRSCAEVLNLESAGIPHGSCIDPRLIEEITGCSILAGKDKNQRRECGCAESVEVGTYNTCKNGCLYCYANYSPSTVRSRAGQYDPCSPLLCGALEPEDKVSLRKMKSVKDGQLRLFQ